MAVNYDAELKAEMERVGYWTRRIAEEKGISIRRLIGLADLNHQTVFDVLHGRSNPTMKTLVQLSRALGVEVGALTRRVPEGELLREGGSASPP